MNLSSLDVIKTSFGDNSVHDLLLSRRRGNDALQCHKEELYLRPSC